MIGCHRWNKAPRPVPPYEIDGVLSASSTENLPRFPAHKSRLPATNDQRVYVQRRDVQGADSVAEQAPALRRSRRIAARSIW